MKINKLKTILLSCVTTTPVVTMIVPLCSCNTNEAQSKKKIGNVTYSKLDTTNVDPYSKLDDTKQPLSLKNVTDSNITIKVGWKNKDSSYNHKLWYRTNSATKWYNWSQLTSCEDGATITLSKMRQIQFFAFSEHDLGDGTKEIVGPCSQNEYLNIQFTTDASDKGSVVIGGTLKSLWLSTSDIVDGNGWLKNDIYGCDYTGDYCFKNLFEGSTGIYAVNDAFLQYPFVSKGCFAGMFKNCTNLEIAPALPITAKGIDENKSLINGLAESCYESMFEGCTSLQTSPVLVATKLASNCYKNMFKGCTNLSGITLNYIGNFVSKFFSGWVDGVTAAGRIMYSGCDTEHSSSAIPTNYGDAIKNQHEIDNSTELTFKADSTSTIGSKKKFRAYNDDTLDVYKDNIDVSPKGDYTEADFDGIYDSTNKKHELTSKISEVAKTATTLTPKYGWDASAYIQAGYANAVYHKLGYIINRSYGVDSNKIKYQIINGSKPFKEDEWLTLQKGETITVPAHSNVVFKGEGTETGLTTSPSNYYNLCLKLDDQTNIGEGIQLKGTAKSFFGKNYTSDALPSDMCFAFLFYESDIVSIDEDFLPFKTLTKACYHQMFYKCDKLTNSPKLPATDIPAPVYYTYDGNKYYYSAYCSMFGDCTSLTKIGKISAKTFELHSDDSKSYACAYMFSGCSSLKTYKANTSGCNLVWDVSQTVNNSSSTSATYCMFSSTQSDFASGNWLYCITPTYTNGGRKSKTYNTYVYN